MERHRSIVVLAALAIFLIVLPFFLNAQPFTASELAFQGGAATAGSGGGSDFAGLIAHYRFDVSGQDAWASHYDLDTNGSVHFTTGKATNAFFSDNDAFYSRAETPVFVLDSDKTFTFWIKYNPITLNNGYYLFKAHPADINDFEYGIGRINTDDEIVFHVKDAGLSDNAVTNTSPTNRFTFVVAWYDHANKTIGISVNLTNDNTLVMSNVALTGLSYSNYFGFAPADGAAGGNTILDEVSIWNRLLSFQDKSNLYHGGLGQPFIFTNWIH